MILRAIIKCFYCFFVLLVTLWTAAKGDDGKEFFVGKNWNLLSIPVKKSVDVRQLGNFTILWKYLPGEKKWAVWSPDEKVMDVIEKYADTGMYEIAKEINWGEGFWIFSDSNYTVEFEGDNYGIEEIALNSGWNLVGTGEAFNVEELDDENVEIVWGYENGRWYAWSPLEEVREVIDYYVSGGIIGGVLDGIDESEGFWVKVSYGEEPELGENVRKSLRLVCGDEEESTDIGTLEGGYYGVSLYFSKTYVGEVYDRTCFLKNEGESEIYLKDVKVSGNSELSVNMGCDIIDPGETCEIRFVFSPEESDYRKREYELFLNGEKFAKVTVYAKPILRPLTSVDIGALPQGIEVRNGYAYVAAFDGGLKIFDVSNPEKVGLVSALSLPGAATNVDIWGKKAYLSLGGEGFAVVDVSEPENPRLLSHIETGNEYWDIEVAGSTNRGIICLSDSKKGVVDVFDMKTLKKVYTINIGIPENYEPIKVAARITDLNLSGYPKGLVIVVAGKNKGLKVFYANLFNGWGELKKIYDNSDIKAIDVVPANNGIADYMFFVSAGDKVYILQTSLIFFGSQPKVSLKEIKKTVISENGYKQEPISGDVTGVDENTWKVVTGNYRFNIIKPEIVGDTASGYFGSIRTEAFGSVDIEGDYIFVADKNKERLEVFSLRKLE